jgi:hypothetical protein
MLKLVSCFSTTYGNRYQLIHVDSNVSENAPLPTTQCEGMVQTSSFCVPDAFRPGGLGRAAYEVFIAMLGESTVGELASRTGRHPQTVRTALKKMLKCDLVIASGRRWRTLCDVNEIESRTEALGMSGASKRQREKHRAERLRFGVSRSLLQFRRADEVL